MKFSLAAMFTYLLVMSAFTVFMAAATGAGRKLEDWLEQKIPQPLVFPLALFVVVLLPTAVLVGFMGAYL